MVSSQTQEHSHALISIDINVRRNLVIDGNLEIIQSVARVGLDIVG